MALQEAGRNIGTRTEPVACSENPFESDAIPMKRPPSARFVMSGASLAGSWDELSRFLFALNFARFRLTSHPIQDATRKPPTLFGVDTAWQAQGPNQQRWTLSRGDHSCSPLSHPHSQLSCPCCLPSLPTLFCSRAVFSQRLAEYRVMELVRSSTMPKTRDTPSHSKLLIATTGSHPPSSNPQGQVQLRCVVEKAILAPPLAMPRNASHPCFSSTCHS